MNRPYQWPSTRLTADLMHELHKTSQRTGINIATLVEMGVRHLLAQTRAGDEALTETVEAGRAADACAAHTAHTMNTATTSGVANPGCVW